MDRRRSADLGNVGLGEGADEAVGFRLADQFETRPCLGQEMRGTGIGAQLLGLEDPLAMDGGVKQRGEPQDARKAGIAFYRSLQDPNAGRKRHGKARGPRCRDRGA